MIPRGNFNAAVNAARLRAHKENAWQKELMIGSSAERTNYQTVTAENIYDSAFVKRPGDKDFGRAYNTYILFVAEDLRGKSLCDWASDKRTENGGVIPITDIISVMETITDAYNVLHEKNLVHLDCSSGNIILRGTEGGTLSASILDFGSSLELDGSGSACLPEDGLQSATQGFSAPEILSADRVDPSADVWSLGVVFLDLLTDYVDRHKHIEDLTRHLSGHRRDRSIRWEEKYPSEPDGETAVYAYADHIIGKALANDPARRYRNAGELREAVRGLRNIMDLDISGEAASFVLWRRVLIRRELYPHAYTEYHVPLLFPEAGPIGLRISAVSGNGEEGTASSMLEDLLKKGEKLVYLNGPGGYGKSRTIARVMNALLRSPDRIPLYMDCSELNVLFAESASASGGSLLTEILRKYTQDPVLCRDSEEEILKRFTDEDRCLVLFIDDVHYLEKDPAGVLTEAVRLSGLKGICVVLSGRETYRVFSENSFLLENAAVLTLNGLSDAEAARIERMGYASVDADEDEKTDVSESGSYLLHDLLKIPFFAVRFLECCRSGHAIRYDARFLEDYLSEYASMTVRGKNAGVILKGVIPHLAYIAMTEERVLKGKDLMDACEDVFYLLEDPVGKEPLNMLTPFWGLLERTDCDSFVFAHDLIRQHYACLYIEKVFREAIRKQDVMVLRSINCDWPSRFPDLFLFTENDYISLYSLMSDQKERITGNADLLLYHIADHLWSDYKMFWGYEDLMFYNLFGRWPDLYKALEDLESRISGLLSSRDPDAFGPLRPMDSRKLNDDGPEILPSYYLYSDWDEGGEFCGAHMDSAALDFLRLGSEAGCPSSFYLLGRILLTRADLFFPYKKVKEDMRYHGVCEEDIGEIERRARSDLDRGTDLLKRAADAGIAVSEREKSTIERVAEYLRRNDTSDSFFIDNFMRGPLRVKILP